MKNADMMRPAEVAELFDVSPRTVLRWAANGRIPSERTLSGRWMFPRNAIEELARVPKED